MASTLDDDDGVALHIRRAVMMVWLETMVM